MSLYRTFNPQSAIELTPRGASYKLSEGQRSALTEKYFSSKQADATRRNRQSEDYNFAQHLMLYPLATGVNLIDDLAGNRLTEGLTGVGKGDVWNLLEHYGSDVGKGLKDYYDANEGAVDLGSGLTGAVGIGYLTAAKALPWVASRLAASTAVTGSRLWQSGAALNASTRSRVLQMNLEAASRQQLAASWSGAALQLRALEVGKWVGIVAAEEAAILTLMNANDIIWDPEDTAGSLFYASLGLGVGAGIGLFRGRAILRGAANHPDVIRARGEAQERLGITRGAQSVTDKANIGLATPAPGASPTRWALQTYHAPAAASGEVLQRQNAESSGALANLAQDLVKLGASKSQTRHWAKEILKDDPLALHGLEEIHFAKGAKQLDEWRATANPVPGGKAVKMQDQILAADKLDRSMVHVNGSWFPLRDSPDMADLVKRGGVQPAPVMRTSQVTEEVKVKTSGGFETTVSLTTAPSPTEFAKLKLMDRVQIAEAFKAMLGRLASYKASYTIPDSSKAHWMQYDAALWWAGKGSENFKLPAGVNSIEELELASLRLKAKEILADADSLSRAEDFLKWNLPVPTYMERVGATVGERFKTLLRAAQDPKATLRDLQTLRAHLQEIDGYARAGQGPQDLTGNLFDFNRSTQGEWAEPVVGVFSGRSLSQQDAILQAVENDLVKDKFQRLATLIDQPGTFISDLTNEIVSNPNFAKAQRVHGLAADQITGLRTTAGQVGGMTRTAEFRYRDNETMLAMVQILEHTQRRSDGYLTQLVEKHLGGLPSQLISESGRASRALIQQFAATRRGWDLGGELVELEPGRWGFALEKTSKNAKRLGRGVEDGDVLLNPRTNQPVVVDELAREYLDGFQRLSFELLEGTNRTRQALGLNPIQRQQWYIPPPPIKNQIVGWVVDADNNVIPGRTIIANSQDEYQRLAASMEPTLERGQKLRTKDQIAAYKDIFDDAQLGWLDPREIPSPARTQQGGLGTEHLNPNTLNDMMGWVKERVENLGLATQRVLFDDQIRSARLRHEVERSVGATPLSGRSIFQEYEATARGIPLSQLDSSITSQAAKAVDSLGRYALDVVWPQRAGLMARQAGRWMQDTMQRMGVPDSQIEKIRNKSRTFKALADELGPYSPYKDFEDYVLQTHGHRAPPEVRQISQKLNTLSSALILRYAEVSHAAMNLFGLITNMPSIVRAGVAPITNFQVGGQTVKTLDTVKILSGAVDDMVHARSGIHWDRMVRDGDASQQVAELNKQFALLTEHSRFGEVMFGTGTRGGAKGAKGLFREKGVDGLVSVMTDVTENWSRQYSHFVGLRLAKLHGITDIDDMHAFAREIANAGIANYSIASRPELYQSPFGSLIGLFTSWSRAYNQRLFRWMENAEFARVGEQYAIQAALFGARSVQGYKALEWLMAGDRDESGEEVPTLTDRIYAKLGPQAGMAVANGGISALTGLSFVTRGDVNLRTPTLNPLESMPAWGVLSKVGRFAQDIATHGMNPTMIGESFIRNMPNRMLRTSLTAVAMGGDEIDASGRIVTDTQTFTDQWARFMGIRSARQQQQADVYYASQTALRDDAARMEPLRLQTRALIRRKGPAGVKSEEWAQLFDEYVGRGGNPRNFRTWIRSQVREVGSTRDMRQVEQFLSNPKNHLRVLRHDMYMGGFQ